jgi:hypothetical protein
MLKLFLKTYLFRDAEQPFFKASIPEDSDGLITYDLLQCFDDIKDDIAEGCEIFDLKLLKTVVQLGKYHHKYFIGTDDMSSPDQGVNANDVFGAFPEDSPNLAELKKNGFEKIVCISNRLKQEAVNEGIWRHYRNIEIPFALSLGHLTQNGIATDQLKIRLALEKSRCALEKIDYALEQKNCHGHTLPDLNRWVRGFGFEEYLPRNGEDIELKDLKLLSDRHPVFELCRRAEKIKRARSILEKLYGCQNIRPQYNVVGTATDRCTGSAPNIMGLPKIFRPVIVPSRKDFGIVECDYSQMEVGVIAALAEDKALLEDFNQTDVYNTVAEFFWGTSGNTHRGKAKILFLGVLYGLSINTIARLIDAEIDTARKTLERLFQRYDRLRPYQESLVAAGTQKGYAESVTGLKRYRFSVASIPTYWEKNWFKNFPVQASAAAVFKRAIIKLNQSVNGKPLRLIVPLYDSIVFEAPLAQLDNLTEIVCDCMVESMKEFFPQLQPKITVNNTCPACWCSEGQADSIEKFLDNPIGGIDVTKGKSGNVDWSKYL